MDSHGRDSKSKMRRRVRKCQRENSDGNFGGDESTSKKVSEPVAPRKEDKSLYKCSHCFLTYRTIDGLMMHLLTHQTKEVKLPKTSGTLKIKQLKAKEKNLPTCKVILTRCDNLNSSYQPIGTVHTLATKIHETGKTFSGKTLPRKNSLKQRKSNSPIEKACFKRSSLKQTSNCGITTEVGMKPHKCQLCSKSFGKRKTLELHVRTHTGERPHRCQLCPKSFAQLGNLKKHIRTHTGERPHRCQLCPKSFAQLGNLKKHIRTHTGERPHRCQLCSKSFALQHHLKTHIRTHTGERPYRCQLCPKSFAHQGHLKPHIRTHTGERPHQCQLCLKSFAHLANLKIHIRSHTGERPYQCQFCSKSFAHQGHLKRHIQTHTE